MAAPPEFDTELTVGAQLEARASHPQVADRVILYEGDRAWTWLRFRNEAVRTSHFLLRRLGPLDDARPGHVAMLLDNHMELLSLYAGCAYAGLTLFGVNTGQRGDSLAGVLNQSRARVLVVDERLTSEVDAIAPQLEHLAPENILVVPSSPGGAAGERELSERLTDEIGKPEASRDAPAVDVRPDSNLMVIYTSGTTGLPKGINNNHMKLLLIGATVAGRLQLGMEDVGYACMPLFHSNAMFLGFHPAFHVGGSLAVRDRFSASAFVPDLLRYGVSYWNYVGEPLHYILAAIEKEHGRDEEAIARQVTNRPDNRLRYALGNGAAPPDIDRFTRWLGLSDMFELYGSTEAAISTFRQKGDPRGSVGEITDPRVTVLDERGEPCPPAQLDADGGITNYAETVGEICRVAEDTGLFQGYHGNREADQNKYRDGVYHSGDLGHILARDGKRYLFFDGRTDDWIRKDGENFSAAQVARLLMENPDVELAAAYGVPCAVSDELVMVALKLREAAVFDPQAFFDLCEDLVTRGGMDRKWVPDFVRLVEEFEYTQTQKILVRHLKQVHFDRRRLPDAPLYWRRRGDTRFRDFTANDYEDLRREFEASERLDLLDR